MVLSLRGGFNLRASSTLMYFLLFNLSLQTYLKAQDLPSATVITFQGNAITQEEREAITNAFESELSKIGKYKLVNRKNIKEVEGEYKFQMMGMTEESNKYYSEMGKAIGANKIIVGQIELIGKLYNIQVKIIDVEKITTDRAVSEEYHGTKEGLIKVSKILAYKLCEKEVPKSIYEKDFFNEKRLNIPKFSNNKAITPWYNTWWFWSIAGAVIIGTAGGITYIVLNDAPESSSSTTVTIGGDMNDSNINIGK